MAKKAYISDGVDWLPLVSGVPDMAGYATTQYVNSQVPTVTISSNPPNAPVEGHIWLDNDTQELFMYDSVYWIEISGNALDAFQYLTQASASNLYITQTSASTTYATITNLNEKPSTGKAIAMAIVFGS